MSKREDGLQEVKDQTVTILGKSIPGRGNSKCKDPEIGTCLAYWRKSKECSVVGAEAKRGDEV